MILDPFTVILSASRPTFHRSLSRLFARDLFDFVSDRLEHILSELLGVVRNLRFKFDGVFIDALDILLVEVDLEVVGVQLELLAWCLSISCWLLWEKGECGVSFHSLIKW